MNVRVRRGRIVCMKISFDLRFAHLPGGGRVYVRRLITTLPLEYPNNHWVLYYNQWCPHQQKIIRELYSLVPPERQGNIELRSVRAPILSLRHHIEFLRFHDTSELYHYPHFDLPSGLRRVPIVVTLHDLYPLSDSGYCSAVKRAYFYRLTRRTVRRAKRVIAISEYTKNEAVRLLDVPAEKIAVVPQSHDPAHHPIDNIELLSQIRKKYNLSERFIFYTGNHKPHKNLARLLNSYARLAGELRKVYPLVLAGGFSPQTKQLVLQATELGIEKDVTFLGWVAAEDLPALYNLAALVVLPSLYEGFGYATVEAMACGTAVACSSGGAIPEVAGTTVRFFDPYSEEEMTAALTTALTNDVDNPQVREVGIRQAEQFSIYKTARLTYEVYQEAVKNEL